LRRFIEGIAQPLRYLTVQRMKLGKDLEVIEFAESIRGNTLRGVCGRRHEVATCQLG